MSAPTLERVSQARTVITAALELYDNVDPHGFATAYVKHVEKTGEKPDIFDAIHSFYKHGMIA